MVWYLDDILVSGENDEQHLSNLKEVLSRLEKYGLRARLSKCQDSVEYLGHEINQEGIQPLEKKVSAIKQAPTPKTVEQLESFLGMINYYGKFLPNLSTIAAPLNQLRHKNKSWKWGNQEEAAFQLLKKELVSTKILVHYDPTLPVKLDCDASSVGIGAVLSHQMKDGTKRPIAFASRSLMKAEQNYPQIEREALSIVWGVRKFQLYLYLKRFTLVTDHKPLTILFNPTKAIPILASARIQRWALFLMDYQYDIQLRRTGQHTALSRLPIEEKELVSNVTVSSVQVKQMEDTLMTAKQISNSTCKNPLLSKVLYYVKMAWPDEVPTTMQPYANRKEELTVEGNCLLWGLWIIIPPELQPKMIKLLHETHPGIIKMKALARSYVWWPGIDKDLEHCSKSCEACQQQQMWKLTSIGVPQQIMAEVASIGPFQGHMWLIVVDTFSKWPEVVPMKVTTATRTIEELRSIFACWGLPEQIITDNGPQFTSEEFQKFVCSNGIKHSRTAPYHPQSNEAAERFVQTFKQAMKKMSWQKGDVKKN